MTKIEQHADLLREAALDVVHLVKKKDWQNARGALANVSKHRSIILAIIEAVEELQPRYKQQRKLKDGIKRSGERTRYVRQALDGIKSGEGREVAGTVDWPPSVLHGIVTSYASKEWGTGAFITEKTPTGIYVVRK